MKRVPNNISEANIRILVIDQDPKSFRSIEKIAYLMPISTVFYVCNDTREGSLILEKIEENLFPNILIVDLDENTVENLQFVRKLRSRPATSDLPVLGFAAGTDEQTANAAYQRGIEDILSKDDSREVIRANIEILFAHWFEHSEIYFVE